MADRSDTREALTLDVFMANIDALTDRVAALEAERATLRGDLEMCKRTLAEISDPYGPDPEQLAQETLAALVSEAPRG